MLRESARSQTRTSSEASDEGPRKGAIPQEKLKSCDMRRDAPEEKGATRQEELKGCEMRLEPPRGRHDVLGSREVLCGDDPHGRSGCLQRLAREARLPLPEVSSTPSLTPESIPSKSAAPTERA